MSRKRERIKRIEENLRSSDRFRQYAEYEKETLRRDTNTGLFDSAVAAFIMAAFERKRLKGIIPEIKRTFIGSTPIKVPFQYPLPMAEEVADTGALGILPTHKTITGATQADPCVITSAAHGLSEGEFIIIEDVVGMTDLNLNTYRVSNPVTDTLELQNIYGVNIDSSGFGAYTSSGTALLQLGVGSENVLPLLYQGYPVRITHELMQLSAIDMLASTIEKTGMSLGRKFDNLLVSAMRTATPSAETYRNYSALTETTGKYITWDKLIGPNGIIEKMWSEYNADGKIILAHPTPYYRLLNAAPVSITQVELKNNFGETHFVQMLGDVKLVKSNHCNFGEIFIIDPDLAGYMFYSDSKGEHRFPVMGYFAHDIFGTNQMGCKIIQPKGIHRVKEDTA